MGPEVDAARPSVLAGGGTTGRAFDLRLMPDATTARAAMTFAETLHSAIERISATASAGFDMLNHMSDGALAIFAIGLTAAVVGLGCLVYGLRGEWQRWAKIHVSYWRRRD